MFGLIKATFAGVTAMGTGMVVGNVLNAARPVGAKVVEKTLYTIGVQALTGVASAATVAYVTGQLDGIVDLVTAGKKAKPEEVKEEVV